MHPVVPTQATTFAITLTTQMGAWIFLAVGNANAKSDFRPKAPLLDLHVSILTNVQWPLMIAEARIRPVPIQ